MLPNISIRIPVAIWRRSDPVVSLETRFVDKAFQETIIASRSRIVHHFIRFFNLICIRIADTYPPQIPPEFQRTNYRDHFEQVSASHRNKVQEFICHRVWQQHMHKHTQGAVA